MSGRLSTVEMISLNLPRRNNDSTNEGPELMVILRRRLKLGEWSLND
jgi:hypothetical protein